MPNGTKLSEEALCDFRVSWVTFFTTLPTFSNRATQKPPFIIISHRANRLAVQCYNWFCSGKEGTWSRLSKRTLRCASLLVETVWVRGNVLHQNMQDEQRRLPGETEANLHLLQNFFAFPSSEKTHKHVFYRKMFCTELGANQWHMSDQLKGPKIHWRCCKWPI